MRKFVKIISILALLILLSMFAIISCVVAPNNPPDVPRDPDPADGATGVSVNVALSWQCNDPNGDALVYDIYFGTSENPPLVESNHASTSYNPGTLSYETTYYWKIVAKDGKGGVTEGPVWKFTTMPVPDGSLKWKFGTGDWVRSSPAIGEDGTIYVGSNDGYLYAINPVGTLKW